MNVNDLYVLVIEPSSVQTTIIIQYLNRLGVQSVDTFTHGQEALLAMQQRLPDVVLSAMHLPDMTGTEVVENMRSIPRLEHITFLLASSETHYRYLEPIRQAGAIAILPKPFTYQDLHKALQSTLLYVRESDALATDDIDQYEQLYVLLVDDSRTSRRYLRQVLDNIGIHQITEACDGAEALAALQQAEYDLIISDYNMPNIDGREMVEHIRSHSNQPTIPVMMVTSEQNQAQLAAIQNAGVSALCAKPLGYDVIKHTIHQLLLEDLPQ